MLCATTRPTQPTRRKPNTAANPPRSGAEPPNRQDPRSRPPDPCHETCSRAGSTAWNPPHSHTSSSPQATTWSSRSRARPGPTSVRKAHAPHAREKPQVPAPARRRNRPPCEVRVSPTCVRAFAVGLEASSTPPSAAARPTHAHGSRWWPQNGRTPCPSQARGARSGAGASMRAMAKAESETISPAPDAGAGCADNDGTEYRRTQLRPGRGRAHVDGTRAGRARRRTFLSTSDADEDALDPRSISAASSC